MTLARSIAIAFSLALASCTHLADALRAELDRGVVQDALRCADAPQPGQCMGVRAGAGIVRTLIDAALRARAAASDAGAEDGQHPTEQRRALRQLRRAIAECQ